MSKSSKNQQNQALLIHKALMIFQFKNKFVAKAYEQDCDLLDSHILSEVEALGVTRFSELVTCFNLGKSLITRRLAALEKLGYLVSKANVNDSRMYDLSITQKGKHLMREIDHVANMLMEQHIRNFSKVEIANLSKLISRFASNLDIPNSAVRQNDLGLRAEMRTMARAMSIVGKEFMKSGISSTLWQILIYIRYSRSQLSIIDLANMLGMSHAGISKSILTLKNNKLIKKSKALDQRKVFLAITDKGKEVLSQVDSSAQVHINTAVANFSSSELNQFVILLEKLAYGNPSEVSFNLGDQLKLIMLSEAESFLSLRKSFVSSVSLNPNYIYSGTLFDENNICLGIEFQQKFIGGAEVQIDRNQAKLVNYNLTNEKLSPLIDLQVIILIIRLLNFKYKTNSLDLGNFYQYFSQFVQSGFLVFEPSSKRIVYSIS